MQARGYKSIYLSARPSRLVPLLSPRHLACARGSPLHVTDCLHDLLVELLDITEG